MGLLPMHRLACHCPPQVVARCRPLNATEIAEARQVIVHVNEATNQVTVSALRWKQTQVCLKFSGFLVFILAVLAAPLGNHLSPHEAWIWAEHAMSHASSACAGRARLPTPPAHRWPPVQVKRGVEEKTFNLDAAYSMDSRQADVFERTARPLVDSVLGGFNGGPLSPGPICSHPSPTSPHPPAACL